jgi:hypothetical protein
MGGPRINRPDLETMTTTTEIEAIVRRVLQGMLASGAAPSSVASPSAANTVAEKKPADYFAITDSLITLASIPTSLDGVAELRVSKKSVVTPSVRDLLKSKNIRVVRGDILSQSGSKALADFVSSSSASSLVKSASTLGSASPVQPILIAGQSSWYSSLKRPLCPKATKLTDLAADDASALRTIGAGLREGHKAGVLIAGSPHNVCWQAARDEKLRPIVVSDWSELNSILKEVPTNLLILSQSKWNAPSTINVIRVFSKHLRTH